MAPDSRESGQGGVGSDARRRDRDHRNRGRDLLAARSSGSSSRSSACSPSADSPGGAGTRRFSAPRSRVQIREEECAWRSGPSQVQPTARSSYCVLAFARASSAFFPGRALQYGLRMTDETTPSLTIVPANEASWEDVQAVFGTRGDPPRCQCQRYKLHPKESWNSVRPRGARAPFPHTDRVWSSRCGDDHRPRCLPRRRARRLVRGRAAQRLPRPCRARFAFPGKAGPRTRQTTASGP